MNLIKELQEKKGFSDSERTIADYLLRHSRLLPSMTTRQLAKKTYTSSAAIVRFCQKLGFGGYTEFRVEFLAQMIQYIESPYGMELSMTDRDSVHSILEKVTRLEIDAMQETYRMLNPADFFGPSPSCRRPRTSTSTRWTTTSTLRTWRPPASSWPTSARRCTLP